MPPKKLTEADKEEILQRYRSIDETTTTLAEQYGVSTSTISRILKQNLDDEEYEALIQQKRLSGRQQSDSTGESERAAKTTDAPKKSIDRTTTAQPADESSDTESEAPSKLPRKRSRKPLEPPADPITAAMDESEPMSDSEKPRRRQRKRSSASEAESSYLLEESAVPPSAAEQMELIPITAELPFESAPASELPNLEEISLIAGEEFGDLGEDDLEEDDEDDLDDLDDLGDDLDDEDEDDDDDGFAAPVPLIAVGVQKGQVTMLPLADAPIPRTCYIVIDRAAELITRPLRDFADLGQLPAAELQERILPVFDNHRVAKRFSRRMQRIVKVPDGRVFYKVGPYLQAKGITRLLIDGQMYTLN